MSIAPRHATLIQIGKETTRGTEVNATRILVVNDATLRRMEEMHHFENQLAGVAARTVRAPVQVRAGGELEVTHPLDFEQSLLPFMAGFKGAVTPSVVDTSARLWTFTPPSAGDPAPDTFTVEVVEDDFTNEDEAQFLYGFCTEIEVRGGLEQVAEISYTLVGRDAKDGTKTAGLSLPTGINPAANLLWTVDVDATWATLGTTGITGQILDFTWRWAHYLFPRYTLDGRADLDFTEYGFRGGRVADLTMTVLVDPNSGFVDDEEANKSVGTGRAVRVELDTGVIIGAVSATRKFTIDGFYHHASDSLQDRLKEQDGNLIATVHLLSTYESVQAQDVVVSIQNILATFP